MNKEQRLALIGLLLVVAGLTSCASGPSLDEQWSTVMRADNIVLYERFLAHNKDSRYSAQGESRLAELLWKNATMIDSIDIYSNYASRYPKSENVPLAKKRIAELHEVEFSEILKNPTVSAYEDFLRKRSSSPHATEILASLDDLMWASAQANDVALEYRRYIDRFQAPKFLRAAQAIIDKRNADGLSAVDWTGGYAPEACNWSCLGYSCESDLDADVLLQVKRNVYKLLNTPESKSPGNIKIQNVDGEYVCLSTLTRSSSISYKTACSRLSTQKRVAFEVNSSHLDTYTTNFVPPAAATRWTRTCKSIADVVKQ